MVTRIQLTQRQKFALADWLKKELDSLNRLKPTRNQAAQMATQSLGFKVTEYNVKSTVDNLEMKIDFKLKNGGIKRSHETDVLRAALIHLYNKLGEPVPDSLN